MILSLITTPIPLTADRLALVFAVLGALAVILIVLALGWDDDEAIRIDAVARLDRIVSMNEGGALDAH